MSASSYETNGQQLIVIPSLLLSLLPLLFLFSCAHAPESIRFGEGDDLGVIGDDAITEASGIAYGYVNPNLLWTHNDSGDSARVFGIDLGDLSAPAIQLFLEGVEARDWEDMALAVGADGRARLYLGDIGDNNGGYASIRVHIVDEPTRDRFVDGRFRTSQFRTIELRYPVAARDAEGLMVDPITGDLYVVSKRESRPRLYSAPRGSNGPESGTLTFEVELPPLGWITAADITRSGDGILMKSYDSIYYWSRSVGESVPEALKRPPVTLPYMREPQGESITWRPDGRAYYTLSEEAANIPARLFEYRAIE